MYIRTVGQRKKKTLLILNYRTYIKLILINMDYCLFQFDAFFLILFFQQQCLFEEYLKIFFFKIFIKGEKC